MTAETRVPYAVTVADQIRTERYYDPEFFALEAEMLWPRVWQMACRLEEIPEPHDFVTYEILDQSVIVVRTEDLGVVAFQNACRHRGVQVASGSGSCEQGFVCPFHGWRYGPDGTNVGIPRRKAFSAHNLAGQGELDLTPVQCDTWGGCAWINLDPDAPPLRVSLEPVASILDAWKVDSLRTEWWYACHLPVNWKLAEEAFVEQYHVVQTHPQLAIPERFPTREGELDPATFVEGEMRYLHAMSEGMAGMVHANDVAVAERQREIELVGDPAQIMATWHTTFNDAVVAWHRGRGSDIPDLNELEATGRNEPMGYAFPHYFVLPMYSSASSYRFRPLGPEETLMEIWSLTRVADGEERPRPTPPEVWRHDDPRFPPIPQQDFSNLPRQQRGLHARGLDVLRLSESMEGHISNYHRVIDGYLAGLGHDQLLPALRSVNVNPLEMAVCDLPL